jgi:RNA polymerase-binding transcription factor DksA
MNKRDDIDIDYFKKNLEEELALVEKELEKLGRRNPDNKNDWEAEPADDDIDTADSNEVADKFEDYEENAAVLKELEIRYNDVKDALQKMKNDDYGTCEIGGELIEEERLIANPAARTCKKHMES